MKAWPMLIHVQYPAVHFIKLHAPPDLCSCTPQPSTYSRHNQQYSSRIQIYFLTGYTRNLSNWILYQAVPLTYPTEFLAHLYYGPTQLFSWPSACTYPSELLAFPVNPLYGTAALQTFLDVHTPDLSSLNTDQSSCASDLPTIFNTYPAVILTYPAVYHVLAS